VSATISNILLHKNATQKHQRFLDPPTQKRQIDVFSGTLNMDVTSKWFNSRETKGK
jgi:hypothetical protein